jgi:hypothetical protein
MPPSKKIRAEWESLCAKGVATPGMARHVSVNLGEFMNAFSQKYLGPDGVPAFKLVFGLNGTGKSHLLLSIQRRALDEGHPVVFMPAKDAGLGEDKVRLARSILREMKTRESEDLERGLADVVQASITRRRSACVEQGLDPGVIVREWAEGLRHKQLPTPRIAQFLSDAALAVLNDDLDETTECCAKLFLNDWRPSARVAQGADGQAFLNTVIMLPSLLGLPPLVTLIDEAEGAIEQTRRRRDDFLQLLRNWNDIGGDDDRRSHVTVIALTPNWVEDLSHYEALLQRTDDREFNDQASRASVTIGKRVRFNRYWMSDFFEGTHSDYEALGSAVIDFAHSQLGWERERAESFRPTMRHLAAAAAGRARRDRGIKRPFVKALASRINDAIDGELDWQLESTSAANEALGAAARAIVTADNEDRDGAA